MRVHWMRYMISEAGHLQRLYLAVKTASEHQVEDLQTLCELYLKLYRHLTTFGPGKRGLLHSKWRSAEPHFSFARQLDLLEWKERETWRITFGAGRSFLALWLDENPPTAFLLNQLLTCDRTFLLPLLTRLVEADYDFATGKFRGLEKTTREVWQNIWDVHRNELQTVEPAIRSPSTVKTRTLLHHAAARIRFLNRMEGLRLNMDKIGRLTRQFSEFEDSDEMPSDSFFRIGAALTGKRPPEIPPSELTTEVLEAFSSLQRAGYASGCGVFGFVNERLFPDYAVDWRFFVTHVRSNPVFATRASFRREDFLLTVEKARQVAK